MEEPKQLSLCIITKNDAPFFPACLSDMRQTADEMLVVDLGSEDATCELARQSGAAVYQPKWEDDFSKILNFCMNRAAGKWVLLLQADEAIAREQLEELKFLLHNPNAEGYLLDVDDGQAVSSPTQCIRLIRRRSNYRFTYRSFAYIKEEELYSLQSAGLRITHRGEHAGIWQKEERVRLLERDLREHPQDGFLQYLKGVELLNQQQYRKSAACLELALQTFVGGYLYVPHLYRCLGICLMALGRDREAENVLSTGYLLFPFYTDLLVLRAQLRRRHGKSAEAVKDLETCLALLQAPSACVPKPEIDGTEAGELLQEIQSGIRDDPGE